MTIRFSASTRAGFLAACLLIGVASTALGEEPMAPDQVQPILLGSELPEATISDLDGNELQLADAIGDDPTLLIFFRGGW
jgi:hypothetical protein